MAQQTTSTRSNPASLNTTFTLPVLVSCRPRTNGCPSRCGHGLAKESVLPTCRRRPCHACGTGARGRLGRAGAGSRCVPRRRGSAPVGRKRPDGRHPFKRRCLLFGAPPQKSSRSGRQDDGTAPVNVRLVKVAQPRRLPSAAARGFQGLSAHTSATAKADGVDGWTTLRVACEQPCGQRRRVASSGFGVAGTDQRRNQRSWPRLASAGPHRSEGVARGRAASPVALPRLPAG